MTRKDIQNVEIQKAVETIIKPGAPIALRLQGSLLYGASRVYNQQVAYLYTDTQKVDMHMRAFFKHLPGNALDPQAGKTKSVTYSHHSRILTYRIHTDTAHSPENLMVLDDPEFAHNLFHAMPQIVPGLPVLKSPKKKDGLKTSSQFSPYSFDDSGSNGPGGGGFPTGFGLSPGASSPVLRGLIEKPKEELLGDGGDIFGLEDAAGPYDWGIEIDEDGNIIDPTSAPMVLEDEPDLPLLPSMQGEVDIKPAQGDGQGDVIMMDEQPLTDGEVLTKAQPGQGGDGHPGAQAALPQRQKRKPKLCRPDRRNVISSNVLKEWQADEHYHKHCCQPKTHQTSVGQARKNAIHLTFGLGIANVGQSLSIPGMIHPLALRFSGDALFTAVTGLEVFQGNRKRTRSVSGSAEDSEEENRRVRPRLENSDGIQQQDQGRGNFNGNYSFNPGDGHPQSPPEVGREAQSALTDPPSSMPWKRGSSLAANSALRTAGSAQRQLGRDQPSSPLNRGVGSQQDIVRYSDDPAMGDAGGMGMGHAGGRDSADSSFDGMAAPAGHTGDEDEPQTGSQYRRSQLEREGAEFLAYAEEILLEHGEARHDSDIALQRKWIAFDDMFVPARTKQDAAAQAFYHVLGLVSKGRMHVEQENSLQDPFGSIYIGI